MTESTRPFHARIHSAVQRAADYLRSKQSYNGGFCFYRRGPVDQPNVKDTYHAIAALKLAGFEVPRVEELVDYLDQVEVSDASSLFYYVFSLELLGRLGEVREQMRAQIAALPLSSLLDARVPAEAWLESTLKIVLLKRRFDQIGFAENIIQSIDSLEDDQGGYGDKANIEDTFRSLQILDALQSQCRSSDLTRVFVHDLQRPSIGFTATRDSVNPNLVVITAGVECCVMLKLRVRYRKDILAFVLACQTADGSFSRTPVALPNIELTHQAVKVIDRLAPPRLPING